MRYGIYLSFAAMLILAVSCKDKTKEPTKRAHSMHKDAPDSPPQPDVDPPAGVGPYVDAAFLIGHMLQAETISWPDVEAKYEVAKPYVELVDVQHKTSYAKEIPQGLAAIKAGESVEVNRHVVTKGLQHVTVFIIEGLLDKLITEAPKNAKKNSDEIKRAFAAIEPTFRRRDDTVYGGEPTLVPALERALKQLESAGSKPAMAGAAMELSTLLSKTYVLSVLFEMKGVEEFCGTKMPDPDKCAVKRTEAGIYYRIIKPAVAARDKEGDAAIEKMIHSEHAVPKYSRARELLAENLPFSAQDLTF